MWQSLKTQWGQQWTQRWLPFWHQLQPREQGALMALLIVLLFAVIDLAIIRPIDNHYQQAKAQLEHQRQQWRDLVKQAEKVAHLSTKGQIQSHFHPHNSSAALAHLQQAVRQSQLSAFLQQMRPVQTPVKGIALRLKSAPADQIFQLLDRLEQQGWVAEKIVLHRVQKANQEVPGKVDAQLIFPLESAL